MPLDGAAAAVLMELSLRPHARNSKATTRFELVYEALQASA